MDSKGSMSSLGIHWLLLLLRAKLLNDRPAAHRPN
jgi:hypothetical protein